MNSETVDLLLGKRLDKIASSQNDGDEMRYELHLVEEENTMNTNGGRMLQAEQVAEILSVSKSYAYKVIEQLNAELAHQGYMIVRGKIDAHYLYKRFFVSKIQTKDNK